MSKPKHTPVSIGMDHPLMVYLDGLDNGFGKEAMEAQRLLAAAPELLEALQRIVNINGSTGGPQSLVEEFKHIAKAAIAKATGGTNE